MQELVFHGYEDAVLIKMSSHLWTSMPSLCVGCSACVDGMGKGAVLYDFGMYTPLEPAPERCVPMAIQRDWLAAQHSVTP
jgi:hypothetical protein